MPATSDNHPYMRDLYEVIFTPFPKKRAVCRRRRIFSIDIPPLQEREGIEWNLTVEVMVGQGRVG